MQVFMFTSSSTQVCLARNLLQPLLPQIGTITWLRMPMLHYHLAVLPSLLLLLACQLGFFYYY